MNAKHQPCGKPGCINCSVAYNDKIIRSMEGPPCDSERAELNGYRMASARMYQHERDLSNAQDRLLAQVKMAEDLGLIPQVLSDEQSFKAGERAAIHRIVKLIAKLATFIVLAAALGLFWLAVFA